VQDPPLGAREIDAGGMVVAPGFIDVHTHYDAQVCWDEKFASIGQYGVTTVVMGNCGIGLAPVVDGDSEYLIQLLARIEGMPQRTLEMLDWNWRSMADYLDAIDKPMGANVVSLVGHSPLRRAVMGDACYERAATSDEVEAMQRELRDALAAGAWGFSSSVAGTHSDLAGRPAPSRLATHAEFGALADVLGEFAFGIIGISPESKLRGLSADDRSLLTLLSLRGGASVNWNPLVYSPQLPDVWRTNLDASTQAAAAGARVYAVFNPAGMGGTRVDLRSLFMFGYLPRWDELVLQPLAEKMRAFANPEVRRSLAAALDEDTSMGVLTEKLKTMWDILRITSAPSAANQRFIGRTVGEVARERGESPLDTMLDVALADDLETVFMQEDSRVTDSAALDAFAAMAASPFVIYGGSDAGAHIDILANESLPARALDWRVREQGSLTLEETVRRFSSGVADAIGLPGRGRLAPGLAGDVVVFDPATVASGDAYVVDDLPGGGERMVTRSVGVHHTIVGGQVAFSDGQPTGALPGRLLRSSASPA
jgi:N-acyl-D-aspartate/D-glutamate deacylase